MARIAAEFAALRARRGAGPGLLLPSAADVVNIRRRFFGVSPSYLAMLSKAGIPAGVDGEGVRFWRPQELNLASHVLSSAGYRCGAAAGEWLVFADYFEESWWYALGLATPCLGKVALLGGSGLLADDTRQEIGSFDDFLDHYENMSPQMYPGGKS